MTSMTNQQFKNMKIQKSKQEEEEKKQEADRLRNEE